MRFFLKHRETELKELMDDPQCDLTLLFNTYAQFKHINQNFSGWHFIYKKWIRPYALKNPNCSILDVGCGGGDVMLALSQWAKKDKINLQIQGIDPDPHAFAYMKTQTFPSNISFKKTSLKNLLNEKARYDFVISNHLMHHLSLEECIDILEDAKKIGKNIIFNDLRRSDIAYIIFKILSSIFYRNSFARYDGCLSIRKSYTIQELAQALPKGWQVQPLHPYHLIVKKADTTKI